MRSVQGRHVRLVSVGVVIASVLVAVSACGQSADLKRLAGEPIAELQLDSAERVKVVTRDAGTTLGKPQKAVIQLTFRPVDDASPTDVLNDAVVAAEGDGWSLRERGPSSGYRGEREADGKLTVLDIYPVSSGQDVVVQLSG